MDPARMPWDEKSNDDPKQSDDETVFAPITSTTNQNRHDAPLRKERSNTSRSLERSWSLNDGVSIGGNDYETAQADEAAPSAERNTGYVVGWDENDPMNPRNMNTARRWLIVVIVSLGSICV